MHIARFMNSLAKGLMRQGGKSKVPVEAAWRLAKSILKLKENHKATFFSPSENRCLLA